jgi:hypothetical protein
MPYRICSFSKRDRAKGTLARCVCEERWKWHRGGETRDFVVIKGTKQTAWSQFMFAVDLIILSFSALYKEVGWMGWRVIMKRSV